MKYTAKGATISPCKRYRYHLWREWREGASSCAFVMLNPSTADEVTDDLTVKKCVGFADRWGFGRIEVVNLYPFRATDPRELWETLADPEGPGAGDVNRGYVETVFRGVRRVVAAWGGGALRGPAMQRIILLAHRSGHDVHAIGTTKGGAPRHPSRLAYANELEVWRPA